MSNVVVEGGTPVALTSLDQLTDKAKVQLWPTPRDMLLLIMPNGFVNESRKLKCTATDLADLVKQVQQSLGLPAESYMSHVVADGDIPVALERLDQLLDKAKVQMWPQEPTSRKIMLLVMPNGFVKESRKLKLKATGGSRTENQNCRTV